MLKGSDKLLFPFNILKLNREYIIVVNHLEGNFSGPGLNLYAPFLLMINEAVIKEIYKKFAKPHKNPEELRLDYFMPLLQAHHSIEMQTDGPISEIVVKDLDEYNPFRRFLVRSLNAVLEFDKMIAFVFRNHILFFGKEDDMLRVHIKPMKPKSIFQKIAEKFKG